MPPLPLPLCASMARYVVLVLQCRMMGYMGGVKAFAKGEPPNPGAQPSARQGFYLGKKIQVMFSEKNVQL